MIKDDPYVVVIGGSILDVKGKADGIMLPRTKNPGAVEMTPGGVGRNVAENLSRLGVRTHLVSPFGNDAFGDTMLRLTRAAGVNTDACVVLDDARTGLFVALISHLGELEASIVDVDILGRLTRDVVEPHEALVRSASFVVLDADVPLDCIEYVLDVCDEAGVPVCIEPVSVAKAQRIAHLLPRVSMLTPNREEAEVLVGFPLNDMKGITQAAEELLRRGIRWVIVTLGPEGVYVASEGKSRFIASIATIVSDSVGAGDALTAGTICGLVQRQTFFESVRMGIAAATMTLMTPDAVNRSLTQEALLEVMERVPAD